MASSCNAAQSIKAFTWIVCTVCVWKTDILEPGTVYESELSNFFDVGVRNVHIGKQFAIITGMGSKLIEVAGQLEFF